MANLASILKSSDMPALAELLRKHGRGKDTVLAHITPKEAALLKARGGRGSRNPKTGLLEFDDGFDYFSPPSDVGSFQTPAADGNIQPPSGYGSTDAQIRDQMAADYAAQVGTGGADAGQQVYSGYSPSSSETIQWGIPGTGQPNQIVLDAPTPVASTAADVASIQGAGNRGVVQAGDPQATGAPAAAAADAAPAAKPAGTDWWSKLTSDPLKLALGLGGAGLGLYNQMQARKQAKGVANQVSNLAEQQKQMAQPYLTEGATQYGQAVQGRMTPVQQQAFDAARAQIAQQASRTGAVGANQAVAVEERMRQQALNGQLTAGLQLINTGDTIMNQAFANQIQALNQNVALNQQANQASASFFGALGQWFGGSKVGS